MHKRKKVAEILGFDDTWALILGGVGGAVLAGMRGDG